jgi:putative endonuclease
VPAKRDVGEAGEEAAARYLAKQGFKLLHRNLRLGRTGELDIVARERETLVFVEVKSRMAGETLGGLVNITAAKQHKLWELGAHYLKRFGGDHKAVRFDAVEVEFVDAALRRHEIKHVRDAFRL